MMRQREKVESQWFVKEYVEQHQRQASLYQDEAKNGA